VLDMSGHFIDCVSGEIKGVITLLLLFEHRRRIHKKKPMPIWT
jgi:hypothetical protein